MFFKIILPVFDMPDCVWGGGVWVWVHSILSYGSITYELNVDN